MGLTVVLADDHPIFRHGLRALLEAEADLQVVGEADDGLEVVRLVERLLPNILVLDLMMPGLGGLEVLRQVGKRCPETKVVIISLHANEGYVLEALRAGALAYVVKEASGDEVIRAIRQAAAGKRYLGTSISERAITVYLDRAEPVVMDPYDTLTAREREVLQLAAEGHSNSEIASRLFISPRTVENHRAHLMHKLALNSHTDLIRYAIRRGILPLEK
jgi:DNA-binding NarL/FixJ family response regulator